MMERLGLAGLPHRLALRTLGTTLVDDPYPELPWSSGKGPESLSDFPTGNPRCQVAPGNA